MVKQFKYTSISRSLQYLAYWYFINCLSARSVTLICFKMQLLFLLAMMAITFCDALQVSTSASVSTTTSLQAVVTPLPCERVTPEPCELQTQERFNRFAYAFIYEKNLTKAFEYIAVDYIVRHSSSLSLAYNSKFS